VLGPVQVLHDDGARVRLASDAQRRLVSVLALRANTIVRSEVLEDFLDLSAGALRTSVSRLRRTVGFDVLVTAPPGYELRTDRVDALRFERLIAEAATIPDAADAARLLQAALHLWQGQPYEEFAHEPWAQAEAQRLVELRAGSIERLAAIEIDRGDWSAAIARLDELIAEQPYRDEPRRLLMDALARAGRRPDALRAFQSYRRFLLAEVGTEPSAEIVALDRAIGAALDGDASDTSDTFVDIAAELPTPWTSYVGRTRDTATVVDLMLTHRLVTLTGAGGCGKTRLALAAAHVLRNQGDRVVRWADLIPASTAAGVAERVLAAVGGTARPGRDVTELLLRWLRDAESTVLVLDNAEHHLDAVARLVHIVLRSCPEVSVLVTSREPLGVAAEHIWRVPALSVPAAAGSTTLDDALRSDAVRLLLERVTAARPGLTLGDADVAWLASICRSADGLPLALELAAASIRSLPPDQVALNLDETLALLGHGPASDVPHHQTMRASIAWSFGMLDPCAETVLRRIAVCAQAFTAETAVEVASDGERVDATTARTALCSLVDKNLVHLDDATGRYRLMETTRQFCHDIDDPSTRADIKAARARWARHVASRPNDKCP